jgi:hypothetical protein
LETNHKECGFLTPYGLQAVVFKEKIFLIGGDTGTKREVDVLKNEI